MKQTKDNRRRMVSLFMAAFKDDMVILGECSCVYHKKHFHHPDYRRPLEVFRMCPSCHQREHGILRFCAKWNVYDLISDDKVNEFKLIENQLIDNAILCAV